MEKCDMKLCGIGAVGPKGQIVIPKEVRETLGVKPGDSFVFFLKDSKYVGLVRNQDMNELMSYVKKESK